MPTRLRCIVQSIIVVLVMNIFRHSIAALKVVEHIFEKRPNEPFSFSSNFQNTVSDSASKHHLASLLSKCSKQFQLSNHRFKQRPNVSTNSVRMHHTSSLILKCSQLFQLHKYYFKQRQNAPYCVLAFKFFSAVPISRTSFQIASECTIHRP